MSSFSGALLLIFIFFFNHIERSSGVAIATLKNSNSGKMGISGDGILESYTSNIAGETFNKKPPLEDLKPQKPRKRSKSSTRPVKAQYQHNSVTSGHEAYLVYQKYYSHFPEPPASSGEAANQLYQDFYSKHPPPKISHVASVNTPSQQKGTHSYNNPQHYIQNPHLQNLSGRKVLDLYQQYFGHPLSQMTHGPSAKVPSFHKNDVNVPDEKKPRIIVHPTRVIKPSFQVHDLNLSQNMPDIHSPAESYASYKPASSQSPHSQNYPVHSGAAGSANQN